MKRLLIAAILFSTPALADDLVPEYAFNPPTTDIHGEPLNYISGYYLKCKPFEDVEYEPAITQILGTATGGMVSDFPLISDANSYCSMSAFVTQNIGGTDVTTISTDSNLLFIPASMQNPKPITPAAPQQLHLVVAD